MRLLAACCFIVWSMGFALALDDDSAKSFLKKCQIPAEENNRGELSYCLGQVATFMAMGQFLVEELRFCPPSARPILGIGALARYLKQHPESESEKSLSAMLMAYQAEWPCKK